MPTTRLLMIAAGLLAALPAAAQDAPAAPAASPIPPTMQIGRHEREVLFSKIYVSDMVRSYRFYTEVIGLRPAAPMPPPTADDPEKDFVEYALNYSGTLADTFFVLMKRKGVTPSAEGAKLSVVGFKVPDISAAVERARAAGSTVIREPGPNAERGYALVTDPDGYTIEFIRGS